MYANYVWIYIVCWSLRCVTCNEKILDDYTRGSCDDKCSCACLCSSDCQHSDVFFCGQLRCRVQKYDPTASYVYNFRYQRSEWTRKYIDCVDFAPRGAVVHHIDSTARILLRCRSEHEYSLTCKLLWIFTICKLLLILRCVTCNKQILE